MICKNSTKTGSYSIKYVYCTYYEYKQFVHLTFIYTSYSFKLHFRTDSDSNLQWNLKIIPPGDIGPPYSLIANKLHWSYLRLKVTCDFCHPVTKATPYSYL